MTSFIGSSLAGLRIDSIGSGDNFKTCSATKIRDNKTVSEWRCANQATAICFDSRNNTSSCSRPLISPQPSILSFHEYKHTVPGHAGRHYFYYLLEVLSPHKEASFGLEKETPLPLEDKTTAIHHGETRDLPEDTNHYPPIGLYRSNNSIQLKNLLKDLGISSPNTEYISSCAINNIYKSSDFFDNNLKSTEFNENKYNRIELYSKNISQLKQKTDRTEVNKDGEFLIILSKKGILAYKKLIFFVGKYRASLLPRGLQRSTLNEVFDAIFVNVFFKFSQILTHATHETFLTKLSSVDRSYLHFFYFKNIHAARDRMQIFIAKIGMILTVVPQKVLILTMKIIFSADNRLNKFLKYIILLAPLNRRLITSSLSILVVTSALLGSMNHSSARHIKERFNTAFSVDVKEMRAKVRYFILGRDEPQRAKNHKNLTGQNHLKSDKIRRNINEFATKTEKITRANNDDFDQLNKAIQLSALGRSTDDLDKSIEILKHLSNRKNNDAMFRLAQIYERDQSKIAEAIKWYKLGAGFGNLNCMHNLGLIYLTSGKKIRSIEEALFWFRKAASKGYVNSQFNIGIIFAKGLGVKIDLVEAYSWLDLAALQGDQEAEKIKNQIEGKLLLEEIDIAHERAKSRRS